MNAHWQSVRLGEVLHYRKEFITIDDLATYKRPRVRLHAQGVVLRDEVPGAIIRTKQQQLCRRGELLVAEIDAKVGGFGMVPETLDGAIVSSHYFLFGVDEAKLSRAFLDYFIRTPGFRDQVEAQGSTNYAAIRSSQVLDYEMPLPPLPEQQRIVARIEELADQVQHALALRQDALDEARRLVQRTTEALLDDAHWRAELLGSLLAEPPRNGLSPKPEVETGGRPMLRINAVSSSPSRFVDLSAVKYVEVSRQEAAPFVLRNDDVFIVRYNGDINRVAKPAIFKSADQCEVVYPDKLMRLRPDHDKVVPDFLVYALNARSVRDQIETLGKTTAGNIGISGANARSFIVAVPPLSEQRRIVSELDSLQSRVDSLLRFQAETATELDALLPAILDRAFKGDL